MPDVAIRRPEDLERTEEAVYSNFDHILEVDVEKRLAEGGCFAQHAAWGFCGYIWYDKEAAKWYEEVWTYSSWEETFSGDSAMDVIGQVNEEYSSE